MVGWLCETKLPKIGSIRPKYLGSLVMSNTLVCPEDESIHAQFNGFIGMDIRSAKK